MVNFGLVTAEICWRVWGTPANFNGFRVFAALLHGTLVLALDHISSCGNFHGYCDGQEAERIELLEAVLYGMPRHEGRRVRPEDNVKCVSHKVIRCHAEPARISVFRQRATLATVKWRKRNPLKVQPDCLGALGKKEMPGSSLGSSQMWPTL